MGYLARRKAERRERVLRVFMSDPERQWLVYGDLQPAAHVRTGQIYQVLGYLERAGWITSGWESPTPADRPPRRWYRLAR